MIELDNTLAALSLPAATWRYGVLAVVLVVCAVTDVRTGKIYNVVTYPAIAIALIGHTLTGSLFGHEEAMGLTGSLAGLAVGFAPMLLAWAAGGIGGGDAKLMAAVGALTGWRFVVMAMFYGFAVAALMAIVVMLQRRIAWQTLKRIGRFLYLALTPGKPGDPATAESPKVPFGLALCIGSAGAGIEAILRGPDAVKLLLGI